MLKTGLTQVYTGHSDRLNFAPIGLALRAAGQNLRVHMTSLLPHQWMEGASIASGHLKPYLVANRSTLESSDLSGEWSRTQVDDIKKSFEEARKALFGGECDLVILTGIHPVCARNVISPDDVLALMAEKPDHVELVLEGPGADVRVIQEAALVTEMVSTLAETGRDRVEPTPARAPTEVVTGNGKGKTTYCLGKAMVMSAMGTPSTVLQFIKSPKRYGEVKAIERLPDLDIRSMGEGFLDPGAPTPEKKHVEAAKRAWDKCLKEIFSRKYGLVVLDEINVAIHYGLLDPAEVREMILQKPHELHLILSGRNAHEEVMREASVVNEMREIKHPFQKGIKARKGIEF
ncbi:MAG: cob(I)yrinic acid a,c-diamide adenosyltransferase [Desulfobacterales bacterium]|nr:cob(I)yrinic acid a,c-diamide adenosyltransferase [Desulfobacterales bacterium]